MIKNFYFDFDVPNEAASKKMDDVKKDLQPIATKH